MTIEQLLKNIDEAITNKTEINTITPEIHGNILKSVVGFLYNAIVGMGLSAGDLTNAFQDAPKNRILPSLKDGEARLFFATKSGIYKTADESQEITIAEGEKALIKFNGENWEKITIGNLSQDIENDSKDNAVSQYLLDFIYKDIDKKINDIKIPEQKEPILNTAGNTASNERLYLTGTQSISEDEHGSEETFVNHNVYMKNGVIYGEVNNYRYMKSGMWNTLGGNIIKDLYNEDYLNAEITSKNDNEALISGGSSGVAYLRLGRIFAESTNRGFNTTILLHVHSQRTQSDGFYGNSLTCFINKANGSSKVNVTPLFLNNDAGVSKGGMVFNKILTKEVTNFDGADGIDIILEYTKGEGNNAICSSAFMLSDAADLYQGEEYKGCFDFTYNITLQKEYISEHNGCTIPYDKDSSLYNKSALYISKTKPDNCNEHSIETSTTDLSNYATKTDITELYNEVVPRDLTVVEQFNGNMGTFDDGRIYFFDLVNEKPTYIYGQQFMNIIREAIGGGTTVSDKQIKQMAFTGGGSEARLTDVRGFDFDNSRVTINGVVKYPTIDYIKSGEVSIQFKEYKLEAGDVVVMESIYNVG